jgi:hypothetical protein
LNDVVRGALAVDRFRFCRHPLGGHQHFQVLGFDGQFDIEVGRLARSYIHRFRERLKADIVNIDRVLPRLQIVDKELPQRIGNHVDVA